MPVPADTIKLTLRTRQAVKPRLRFDKVVLELIARLQAGLDASVPDGVTVVVTCTAPIRLSGKTAETLAERVRLALARNARRDIAATLHDNNVRVRFVQARVKGAAKMVGFVHNPDPGAAETLLDAAQALIEALSAAKPKRKPVLVIENPGDALGKTWGYVYAAIAPPPRYAAVTMTFGDGSVQSLHQD
jgi:hypothetical protein